MNSLLPLPFHLAVELNFPSVYSELAYRLDWQITYSKVTFLDFQFSAMKHRANCAAATKTARSPGKKGLPC